MLVAVTRRYDARGAGDVDELTRLVRTKVGCALAMGSGRQLYPEQVRVRQLDAAAFRTVIGKAIAEGKLTETSLVPPDIEWIPILELPDHDPTYNHILEVFDRNCVMLFTSSSSADSKGVAIHVDPSELKTAVELLKAEIAAGNLPDCRLLDPEPSGAPETQRPNDPR